MKNKEIIIKITFDDSDGYKGHGDNTSEVIIDGIETFLKIDLEGDGVIKKGWSVELIEENK